FSLLTADGTVALRLPEGEREQFLKKYKTVLVEQYGVVMKEYVAVPDALLQRTGELARFFRLSRDYVAGLKPKPTTRKKPAGRAPAKAASGKKPGSRGRRR